MTTLVEHSRSERLDPAFSHAIQAGSTATPPRMEAYGPNNPVASLFGSCPKLRRGSAGYKQRSLSEEQSGNQVNDTENYVGCCRTMVFRPSSSDGSCYSDGQSSADCVEIRVDGEYDPLITHSDDNVTQNSFDADDDILTLRSSERATKFAGLPRLRESERPRSESESDTKASCLSLSDKNFSKPTSPPVFRSRNITPQHDNKSIMHLSASAEFPSHDAIARWVSSSSTYSTSLPTADGGSMDPHESEDTHAWFSRKQGADDSSQSLQRSMRGFQESGACSDEANFDDDEAYSEFMSTPKSKVSPFAPASSPRKPSLLISGLNNDIPTFSPLPSPIGLRNTFSSFGQMTVDQNAMQISRGSTAYYGSRNYIDFDSPNSLADRRDRLLPGTSAHGTLLSQHSGPRWRYSALHEHSENEMIKPSPHYRYLLSESQAPVQQNQPHAYSQINTNVDKTLPNKVEGNPGFMLAGQKQDIKMVANVVAKSHRSHANLISTLMPRFRNSSSLQSVTREDLVSQLSSLRVDLELQIIMFREVQAELLRNHESRSPASKTVTVPHHMKLETDHIVYQRLLRMRHGSYQELASGPSTKRQDHKRTSSARYEAVLVQHEDRAKTSMHDSQLLFRNRGSEKRRKSKKSKSKKASKNTGDEKNRPTTNAEPKPVDYTEKDVEKEEGTTASGEQLLSTNELKRKRGQVFDMDPWKASVDPEDFDHYGIRDDFYIFGDVAKTLCSLLGMLFIMYPASFTVGDYETFVVMMLGLYLKIDGSDEDYEYEACDDFEG